jgi:hypothetical protein
LQQKHKETDKNITQAFEDLSKLMNKVKICCIIVISLWHISGRRDGEAFEEFNTENQRQTGGNH